MPDNNNTPRTLRWLKQRKAKAHGAVVAAFAVLRAQGLTAGQRVVVICHSMKAVHRVLALAEHCGVAAKQWKKSDPLPVDVPLVVADFRATEKRKSFHAEAVVFEVYAGGSKQSFSAWTERFLLVRRSVPEVAVYVKTHSLTDETETEEQDRADVQQQLMGVDAGKVRTEKDQGALEGRRDIRASWGADPRALVRERVSQIFQADPDETLQPVLTTTELQAVLEGSTARWIQWGRETKNIKDLEEWAGSPLSDAHVLLELRHSALTNARALANLAWGAEQQRDELYGQENSKMFAERDNVFVRRRHLTHLLDAAGIKADVEAMRPVLVDASMSKAVQRAVPWSTPGARRDLFLMLGLKVYDDADLEPDEEPRKVTVQRVLRRCGYVATERWVEHQKTRSRWWVPFFAEQVAGSTSTNGPVLQGGDKVPISPYIEVLSPPCRIQQKPGLNGHAARQKRREGVTVLLAPGIESSGLGVEGSATDTKRRTVAMKTLLDHATPVEGEPGGCGWKQVTLPGPGLWVSRRLSPRLVAAWASNIPNFARGHVYAPAGFVFVNFDFKSCHYRIAQMLLKQAMPKSTFFTDLFARGDVYSSLAADLGLSRDAAKLVAIKLLNGAEESTLTADLAEKAAAVVSRWRKHNPWVAYCAAATAGIRDKHNKRSRIACMLQSVEAQLLEATLVQLNAQGVPFDEVLPLYDGGLLMCRADDAECLKRAVADSGMAAAAALGMPEMGMEVGVGVTWKKAQEEEK